MLSAQIISGKCAREITEPVTYLVVNVKKDTMMIMVRIAKFVYLPVILVKLRVLIA